MCILLLFNASAGCSLSLADIITKLSTREAADERGLKLIVHAALLSLTADKHAVLTSSSQPIAPAVSLSGTDGTLPYADDAMFQTNGMCFPVALGCACVTGVYVFEYCTCCMWVCMCRVCVCMHVHF